MGRGRESISESAIIHYTMLEIYASNKGLKRNKGTP